MNLTVRAALNDSPLRVAGFVEPVLGQVAPQGQAAPLAEARIMPTDLFIRSRAPAIVLAGKLRAHPRIEAEAIVTANQFQNILRRVITDAFDALHLALQFV